MVKSQWGDGTSSNFYTLESYTYEFNSYPSCQTRSLFRGSASQDFYLMFNINNGLTQFAYNAFARLSSTFDPVWYKVYDKGGYGVESSILSDSETKLFYMPTDDWNRDYRIIGLDAATGSYTHAVQYPTTSLKNYNVNNNRMAFSTDESILYTTPDAQFAAVIWKWAISTTAVEWISSNYGPSWGLHLVNSDEFIWSLWNQANSNLYFQRFT